MKNKGEIIVYQPEKTLQLEVRMEDETVWLTQAQMADLFETTSQNITLHIKNIYTEQELETDSTCKDFLQVREEGSRMVKRIQKFYNLDVIISVGYRVKSRRGTQFRIWASKILKDYLLKGYSINKKIEDIEAKLVEHDQKIDFFIKTSLPPVEGIFFDGQLFDAYKFAADLIKSAHKSIVLIDNYVDESILIVDQTKSSCDRNNLYCANIKAAAFRPAAP